MKLFSFNLRISLRNIIRFRKYSVLNIVGLSVGMATVILILLWVYYEVSYDKFHSNIDNLYRVVQDQHYSGRDVFHVTVTPTGVYYILKEEFPDVKRTTRYNDVTFLIQHDDQKYVERVHLVDPEFLQMFSFPLLQGNPETALNELHSIVLTDRTAKKLFGEQEALGKQIVFNDQHVFNVTGIIESPPSNSHIWFNYLIPFEFYKEIGVDINNLGNNFIRTYVELADGNDKDEMNEKLIAYQKEKNPDYYDYRYLQPIKDIHLHWLGGGGPIQNIRLFTLIAALILIIAAINFINLSTALATHRYREIGIKKVLGSTRHKLIRQFLSETILIAIISFFIALILVEIALPFFTRITGKDIAFNLFDWRISLGLVAVTLITGILSGLYPAFYLSSFNSVAVLKRTSEGKKRTGLRQVLVVLQFGLAITLIANTIIIKNQQEYMQKKELGINNENILYIPVRGPLKKQYGAMKNELIAHPGIKSVTLSNHLPTLIGSNSGGFNWKGKPEETDPLVTNSKVDFDYAKTFSLKLIEGEFFPRKDYFDSTSVVINKTFAEIIGMDPIVNEPIEIWGTTYTIAGVVDDYHFKPLHHKIEPIVLYSWGNDHNYMFIRFQSQNYQQLISNVENIHTKFNPAYPFEYHFLDDEYDRLYKSEEQRSKIIGFFSIIAIFISCLGLYGLSSFLATQKTKEIGIRKSNGAQVKDILQMFSKYFTKWVLVAFLIATPVSYYFMNNWLQNFAYKTSISWWIFIVAGMMAYAIALVTVSFQSWRAANKNPVDSLRYE